MSDVTVTTSDRDPRRRDPMDFAPRSNYDDSASDREELSRQSRSALLRSPARSGQYPQRSRYEDRASDRESDSRQGRAVSPRPRKRQSEYLQRPGYEERSSYHEAYFRQGRAVSPRQSERQIEYPQRSRYEDRSSYRDGHFQQGRSTSPRSREQQYPYPQQRRYEDRNLDYEQRSRPRRFEAQPDMYARQSPYGFAQSRSANPPPSYEGREFTTLGRNRASRPVSPPKVQDWTIASSHDRSFDSMDAQVAEIQAFLKEQATEKTVEDTADKTIEAMSADRDNHSDHGDEIPTMIVDKTPEPRAETVDRATETVGNDRDDDHDSNNMTHELEEYTFTAKDQFLLGELAKLGATSQKSTEKFWSGVFRFAEAEHLDSRLTTHEALDVALSAALYLREIQDSGNSIELVSPAFADEVRLITKRDNGRTVYRGEVLCHWYSSLKYPSKTTPLLTKLQFGEWPCTHQLLQVAGQHGFDFPEEISRLVLQTTVCACRYQDTEVLDTVEVETAGDVETAVNTAPEDTLESSKDQQETPDDEDNLFVSWNDDQDDAIETADRNTYEHATESWNVLRDEDDVVIGAFETAIEDALTTVSKVQGNAIQESDDLETARQRAAEEAMQRKAAKIKEQKANTATFAQRKADDLVRNLDFLEDTRARLQRDTEDVVNCFAAMLLPLISHYCENGDGEIADVTTRSLQHNGVQLPPLESILAIEPKSKRNKGSSWATGELITYLLDVALASGIPNGHHVETNPASIHTFAVSKVDNDTEHFERLIADNNLAHAEGRTGYYPAEGMTADCTSLHIVWNPVGNHWLQSTFTIDPVKRTGRMILRNSLWNAAGQPGRSVKRARHDLPYLARLVSQRPDLGWDDIVWGPVEDEDCAKQNNADDCGFLACDTARRVVLGQALHLPETHKDRETFGRRLRWEALTTIFRWIFEFDVGEILEDDDDFYADDKRDGDPAGDSGDHQGDHQGNEGEDSGQTSITTDIRCGPCQDEDSPCDGQSPCASCEEAGCFCWYNDWTAELEAGRNVRTLICDCLLEGHGSASVHEIADYLEKHMSDLIDVSRDRESLRERVSTIMGDVRSSSTFILSEDTPDTPGNEVYTLASGFGRSLGSDRLQKLCGSTGCVEHVSDDMDLNVTLVIPTVRHSGAHRKNNVYDRSLDRAKDLMTAHHARFSKAAALPPKVETPDALQEMVNAHTRCWAPRVLEPGSSNIPYLHDERNNEFTMAMLERLNEIAEQRHQQLVVLILFNGFDGLTTENSSWKQVVENYSWLDIRLTMVVPSKYSRHSYGRLDEHIEQLIWVHLSMTYLAKLYDYDADAELEFHLCKHQDIHVTQLDVDPSSNGCQACLSEYGLLGSEWCWLDGSADPRKVQDFFCHATFIHLLELIKYLKLDCSIFHSEPGFINPSNSLAAFLTGRHRNNSVLPNLTNVECERCGESPGPFTRGSDSMVSLRCAADSAPAPESERNSEPDQEQEQSTSEVQDAQLEAGPSRYRCEICNTAHHTEHGLTGHQNAQHKGPLKCPDERCHDFGFRSERALKDHRRVVHEGKQTSEHGCTMCEFTASNSTGLAIHTFNAHEGTYGCTRTAYAGIWSFQSERALNRHTTKYHSHEYKCSLCGQEFLTRQVINVHQRRCHEGSYQCRHPGCEGSFAFDTGRALTVHSNRMHRTGKYKCGFKGCQVSFNSRMKNSQHIESHRNETSRERSRLPQRNGGQPEEPPKKRARVTKKQTAAAPPAHQTTTMQHTGESAEPPKKRARVTKKQTAAASADQTTTDERYGFRSRKTPAPAEDAAENEAAEDAANTDEEGSIASMGSVASDDSDEIRVALPQKRKRKTTLMWPENQVSIASHRCKLTCGNQGDFRFGG
jgi:hypothetical protein